MSIRRTIPPSILYPLGKTSGSTRTSPPRMRVCAVPDCPHPGEYRAPRDRSLAEYIWLCLDHVRQHNRNWNYCQGMSAEELEQQIRSDTCWQRPSWRLGGASNASPWPRGPINDPFGFTYETGGESRKNAKAPSSTDTAEEKALRLLDLCRPLSRNTLRARFVELAKRYHPDINPNDKSAEDHLKEIIGAYRLLLKQLDIP